MQTTMTWQSVAARALGASPLTSIAKRVTTGLSEGKRLERIVWLFIPVSFPQAAAENDCLVYPALHRIATRIALIYHRSLPVCRQVAIKIMRLGDFLLDVALADTWSCS